MKKAHDNEPELLKKQAEEWKAKYLRALADYQNLEKRTAQDRIELAKYASAKIIHELLAVLDTLELAQKHLQNEGLGFALGDFYAVLARHGVKKIEVMHKTFNPVEMECVEVVNGEKDNEVVEEIRPGYKINDKIIRVARVKVSQLKLQPEVKSKTDDIQA